MGRSHAICALATALTLSLGCEAACVEGSISGGGTAGTPVAPVITSQPQALARQVGEMAVFTVVATGTSPLAYAWAKDGVFIAGATLASLTLSEVGAGDAGVYTVRANGDPADTAFVRYLDRFLDTAITVWRANFIRVVLDMSTYYDPDPDWSDSYRATMEAAIRRVGRTYPNVYLLLTPCAHFSMVEGDPGNQASMYPTETTFELYRKLVDSFHDWPHVVFALTNEGGGSYFAGSRTAQQADLYRRAIAAIRAQEDTHGGRRHLIAVQGPEYAGVLTYYSQNASRNVLNDAHVVYEAHHYPPYGYTEEGYTFSNIPVFIGEYGMIDDLDEFFLEMESKKIPNLVWIMDAWGYCQPTVLQSTGMSGANPIQPNALGTVVMRYLQNPPAP
jgi:hypothetical protein